MKPYYNINIKAAIAVGLKDFDFNDLALYEFCKDAVLWEDGKPLWHDNRQWKWVSYDLIKSNIPCFDYSSKTLYRMLVKLCNMGLLERCPANKKEGMVYLAIGPNGLKLERYIREFSSDKIERDLGQNSPTPRTDLSEYSNTEYSKQNIKLERETHAREEEKPIVIEQPEIKVEQPKILPKSTLDIPTCEGHGVKISIDEYPRQDGESSPPFIHPDLIDRIPVDKRIDLWWKLYGIKQAEIKVESEMIQAGIADPITFAAIYLHTFLYVAVTERAFRVPPIKYFKEKTWRDDIVDRRKKKKEDDGKVLGNEESPMIAQIKKDMAARAWEKQQAIDEAIAWNERNGNTQTTTK